MTFDPSDFPSDLDVFVEYQARFVRRSEPDAVKFDKWLKLYRKKYPLTNHARAVINEHFRRELEKVS